MATERSMIHVVTPYCEIYFVVVTKDSNNYVMIIRNCSVIALNVCYVIDLTSIMFE